MKLGCALIHTVCQPIRTTFKPRNSKPSFLRGFVRPEALCIWRQTWNAHFAAYIAGFIAPRLKTLKPARIVENWSAPITHANTTATTIVTFSAVTIAWTNIHTRPEPAVIEIRLDQARRWMLDEFEATTAKREASEIQTV